MTEQELLALHRELVAIPSLSHQEQAIAAHMEGWLSARGVVAHRVGDNVYAVLGESGPLLCLNSHLDTVPPAPGWTRPPHEVASIGGRVYGLGSNDAKASVASMLAAFVRLKAEAPAGIRVMLALVAEEETGGKGAEALVPELAARGLKPDAAVVGEPTGLEIATSQKGLLVLELRARGTACHAAHAQALGAQNAIRRLARDLLAIHRVDFGPPHPQLGPVTAEPTMLSGGTARNMVPSEASCVIDVRTNPHPDHEQTAALMRALVHGELKVLSDRLRPYEIDPHHPLVRAAQQARPQAQLFGSRGLSDLVFFAAAGIPAIKVGPGQTERSHTADEYVLESEIVAGAEFYEAFVRSYASVVEQETHHPHGEANAPARGPEAGQAPCEVRS